MSNESDALRSRYVYIACPWTPVGGGMYKVADYLIQSQRPGPGSVELRPLDTRGAGGRLASLWVLAVALIKIFGGRLSGRLCGVHVNMAERLSVFRKGMVVVVSRALGLPVVLHLHAAQLHRLYPGLPAFSRALIRWVFSKASKCIVLGEASRGFVVDSLRVPPEKVEIVINGVPGPAVARRPVEAGRVPQLLFLGNLAERKGVSDLLRALTDPAVANLPMQAVLAGGGEVELYKSLAIQLGLQDRVVFTGWADQAEAARLMAQADALVLPSYDEGLPLVILEALANGVAVICSPVGEIPTVLEDGVTAKFVRPGDAAGIAQAIRAVFTDDALRQTLEANGRAIYLRSFSLEAFTAHVAEIHLKTFGACAGAAAPRSERVGIHA